MIELTPEQLRAVQQGEPVRVTDPSTPDPLVVMRADIYERVADILPPPSHDPPADIDPQLLRSMQAFWRDLPELLKLKSKSRQWVAYRGDERVAFGGDDLEVYQACFARGLKRGEFYVGWIKPDDTPPWGTVQGDWSLYEVTDVGEYPCDDA
jgi:hypothetical protein